MPGKQRITPDGWERVSGVSYRRVLYGVTLTAYRTATGWRWRAFDRATVYAAGRAGDAESGGRPQALAAAAAAAERAVPAYARPVPPVKPPAIPMPTRPRPCGECPWARTTAPGQFPAARYEALRGTTGGPGDEAPVGAPLFACHKSQDGRDLPCAGWLAAVGRESLTVRLLVCRGRLPASALRPGADWPPLYDSYEEMAAAMAAADGGGTDA